MKIYIAGKITGTTDYHERFAAYADKFRREGHSVFNPAAANQEGRSKAEIMAFLLPRLCECDVLALMRGWEDSPGACVEFELASYIGLKIWGPEVV